MNFITKAFMAAPLILSLVGCDNSCVIPPSDSINYVDLNGDGRKDIVILKHEPSNGPYRYSCLLTAKISNPDGSYGEPKLLRKFEPPTTIDEFVDMDGDGYQDLVLTMWNSERSSYDTFLMRNNRGNFGKLELMNRQEWKQTR